MVGIERLLSSFIEGFEVIPNPRQTSAQQERKAAVTGERRTLYYKQLLRAMCRAAPSFTAVDSGPAPACPWNTALPRILYSLLCGARHGNHPGEPAPALPRPPICTNVVINLEWNKLRASPRPWNGIRRPVSGRARLELPRLFYMIVSTTRV
jgi:hypothetical protein